MNKDTVMIERWLTEINTLPGVETVFIASGRGSVLYNAGKLKLSSKELEDIALRVLRIGALFNEKDENVSEIELFWKNVFIISKISNNILLTTICQNPKILPLLRITLNVSLSHLLQEKKIIKQAKNHATDKTLVLRKGKFDEDELSLLSSI
ncbi:MAG: hypothetical protein H6627_09545 [Calditrichae bacterium]|nr:hypothetical protein [Calditrichota bacterium]MCB9058799.1 hypothetical protein [Calditrichia bacterium]